MLPAVALSLGSATAVMGLSSLFDHPDSVAVAGDGHSDGAIGLDRGGRRCRSGCAGGMRSPLDAPLVSMGSMEIAVR